MITKIVIQIFTSMVYNKFIMSLQDIEDLPEDILPNQEGHIEDTKKMVRGLKTVKSELEGRLSEEELSSSYAPIGATGADTAPLSRYIGLDTPPLHTGVAMSITSNAPTWGIAGYITPYLPGKFTISGPPLVDGGSGNYWASGNGSNAGANVVPHEHSFFVQGPQLAGMFYTYGDTDIQIMVDGRLVKPSFTLFPAAAGSSFVHLDFTDDTSQYKVREIRVFVGQAGLAQWLVPAGGDIWADTTRRYVIGIAAADSYFHGAGSTVEGAISAAALGNQLAIQSGGKCTVISAGAQGGTGYINPGTGTTTSPGPNGQTAFGAPNRVAKFAEWASKCDAIVVAGGANDGDAATYPVASVVAAAEQAWSDYAAAAPGVPLIVIGIQSGVYPSINAALDTLNDALKAAALAHPDVTAYVDDRAAPTLIYGTGNIGSKTGDGNADIMVTSDGVHPTRFGNEYITRQRISRMGNIPVPAI